MCIRDSLTESRDLISELLETIFYDLADVKKGRLYVSGQDQRRAHAEDGLREVFPTGDIASR